MAGGQNDQTLQDAGIEANLDVQFGLGLTFPTPGTFYSVGGSPPFNPSANTPTNTNEPYDNVRGVSPFFHSVGLLTLVFGVYYQWLQFMLSLRSDSVPQTISTSYTDDEQTGENSIASLYNRVVS